MEGVSREGLGHPQVEVNGPAHLMVRGEASDSETRLYGRGADLRTTRMARKNTLVRNQKASNEPEREAGQPWERLTPGTNRVPAGHSLTMRISH